MLEYKPKEELIALITRYEQELAAERESAEAEPCKAVVTVDTPELQRLIEYWRNEPYGTRSFENAWSELIAHIEQHTARAVAAADKNARQNLARVLGLGISEPRSFAWDYLFTIVAAALEEQPVAQPVAGELPPLPVPCGMLIPQRTQVYSADQMKAYAQKAMQPVQQPAAE